MRASDCPEPTLTPAQARRLDPLCDQFEAQWLAGASPRLEEFLAQVDQADRPALLRELLDLELRHRDQRGERPTAGEYRLRLPEYADVVQAVVSAFLSGGTNPLVNLPGYEVLEEIGRGGMGVVYKARQVGLNRIVALKMVLAGDHAGPEERVRFLAEAEAIAAVRHPGIVAVYDFGTHEGLPYFTLEFCAGGSLADRLAGNPLPPQEAAALVEQIARAVQAAHDRGIVHRDLKPGNILLSEASGGREPPESASGGREPPEPASGGREPPESACDHSLLTSSGGLRPPLACLVPRITDFGLAKRVEAGPGLTTTGAIMGTPSYLAPEQAQGKKEVGPSADIYALGAILYECLTGRPPFRAATPFETILQVISEEPVPPRQLNPAVPRDLEVVCLKCLHKQSNRRYATAADLADDLQRWQTGRPIVARPSGPLERARKWAWRRPAAAALVAVSVLAVLALAVLTAAAVGQWRSAAAALRSKQRAQASALLTAHPRAVPALLDDLAEKSEVLPQLRQVWDEPDTPANRPRRMRAALVLLPHQPELVRADLVEWLLEVPDPAELLVVRAALQRCPGALPGELWQRLARPGMSPGQRLRILAALAGLDPRGAGWKKSAELALGPWLSDDPLYLGDWATALRPARDWLLGPLTRVFLGERLAERRLLAASILADFARDRADLLAELIVEADDRQFDALLPALRRHRAGVLPVLLREVGRQAEPAATEQARERLARRQAGAGLALARLGQPEQAWRLLRHGPYPEARSRLIHRLGPCGVPAGLLAARLAGEKEVSIRRALILALGEYSGEQVPTELRQGLIDRLLGWYRDDPDPGIHGAIDWLLRQAREGTSARRLDWRQARALEQIDEELARGKHRKGGWYINGQGQTLAVIEARQPSLMGSTEPEAGHRSDEKRHWRRIDRRYALGTKPVTVAQFQRFLKAHPEVKHEHTRRFCPEADCPIISVTWYEAAQYCRWLSEQEGVPEQQMVYPSVAAIEKCKDGVTPLRLPADYLKRTGYRLPTEAEWEYACRAGARTSRYYGSSREVLPRYSWYSGNADDRTWPVGQKKPNDLGLFDMHGNAWTWCQESGRPYAAGTRATPAGDDEDRRDITAELPRVLRGASFTYPVSHVRAAYRNNELRPGSRYNTVGLRLARTLP